MQDIEGQIEGGGRASEWAMLGQIPGRHFEYSKLSRLGKSSRRSHSEGDIPKELVSKVHQGSPRTKGLP